MMKGYYFITDSLLSRAGNESDVAAAEAAGAAIVQYRCKGLSSAERYTEAKWLRSLCRNAKFVVNDRVDIALAADADGVHLGQSDLPADAARRIMGPDAIIGLSVHSLAEALAGVEMGVDYLGVGPIFATTTKKDAGPPLGPDLLTQIRAAVRLPIAAIGGIALQNAPAVVAAGADMVCAVSAVVSSQNVAEEIGLYQAAFAFSPQIPG